MRETQPPAPLRAARLPRARARPLCADCRSAPRAAPAGQRRELQVSAAGVARQGKRVLKRPSRAPRRPGRGLDDPEVEQGQRSPLPSRQCQRRRSVAGEAISATPRTASNRPAARPWCSCAIERPRIRSARRLGFTDDALWSASSRYSSPCSSSPHSSREPAAAIASSGSRVTSRRGNVSIRSATAPASPRTSSWSHPPESTVAASSQSPACTACRAACTLRPLFAYQRAACRC